MTTTTARDHGNHGHDDHDEDGLFSAMLGHAFRGVQLSGLDCPVPRAVCGKRPPPPLASAVLKPLMHTSLPKIARESTTHGLPCTC
jgi:hypothetical protein